MMQDASLLASGTELEADLCIIGAGPAGLTLAREFIGSAAAVVLLESGGSQAELEAQLLNQGAVVGDPYAGLGRTRHRQVGGTANTWNTSVADQPGAKYVPLDPIDFEARPDVPLSGWPFDRPHLEPFYRRAQVVCGLGAFAYDGADWETSTGPRVLSFGKHLTTRVYQCGLARPFTQTYVHAVSRASNLSLYHHVTVTKLVANGDRLVGAECVSGSGNRIRIRAGAFVLAAGAIENVRLLLLSDGSSARGLGNEHGWLGRCFMEHPRDRTLTLVPSTPDLVHQAEFYDLHRAEGGTMIVGRLAIREESIRSSQLPNVSITLLPHPAAQTVVSRLGTWLVERRWRSLEIGYGWSRLPPRRQRFDRLRMLINLEQRPHPENRIVLARDRDALGMPKVELQWHWRDEEQAELERLRHTLREWVEASGIGRVEVETGRPDPNAHHHAGTTRMHTDPRFGVADADARVHGTENLYVAGASVFPTAGFANPTLTIVALALRLADHLKQMLGVGDAETRSS